MNKQDTFIDPKQDYLRIAVASDLHAYDGATLAVHDDPISEPSHLRVDLPENIPEKHPIVGLESLITDRGLTADLLLCPGDIGHKAIPAGVKYGWSALQRIKKKLGAKHLAATSGNHDLDSRFKYNDFDAKGVLQSLVPQYPLPKISLNDKYWSRNFAVHKDNKVRLVVLNSSAYHGNQVEELDHGRIADTTLSYLQAVLKKDETRPVNILLCHHHPQQHQEVNLGDYDVMKGGQLLLDLLGSGFLGEWLIVHGHKHHPKITYASGGTTSAIVLSAASLCYVLYKDLQTVASNQFHLIYLPLSLFPKFGLVGRVQSWSWVSGKGWEKAEGNRGLPFECGFGTREKPIVLAPKLSKVLPDPEPFVMWSQVREELPQVDFLTPHDYNSLRETLEKNHKLSIVEQYGLPSQLGRMT